MTESTARQQFFSELIREPIDETSIQTRLPGFKALDFAFSWNGVKSRRYDAVLGTCALAVMVNAATFFLLGKTSPVSYQVMGHLKTVLVLGGGYFFFDTSANMVRREGREWSVPV